MLTIISPKAVTAKYNKETKSAIVYVRNTPRILIEDVKSIEDLTDDFIITYLAKHDVAVEIATKEDKAFVIPVAPCSKAVIDAIC